MTQEEVIDHLCEDLERQLIRICRELEKLNEKLDEGITVICEKVDK